MNGIELGITDDGRLVIRCLEHDKTHTGTARFCCPDVMVRAMSLGIQSMPEGYHARMLGTREPKGLSGLLFDIATAPLLAFNSEKRRIAYRLKQLQLLDLLRPRGTGNRAAFSLQRIPVPIPLHRLTLWNYYVPIEEPFLHDLLKVLGHVHRRPLVLRFRLQRANPSL